MKNKIYWTLTILLVLICGGLEVFSSIDIKVEIRVTTLMMVVYCGILCLLNEERRSREKIKELEGFIDRLITKKDEK